MPSLLAVAGVVLVAAITPGPNNLVVLRAAVAGGVRAALLAIAGIVAGGLVMLAVVAAGLGGVLVAAPRLRLAIACAGAVYLAWLGLRLALAPTSASEEPRAHRRHEQPATALSMLAFQFLNPKGWVMVATATAAWSSGPLWQLAILFAVISAACLLLWSCLGSAMARYLDRPSVARWFDRAMGTLLVISAVALVLES